MIAWFARNGVAANLLMLFLILGGIVSFSSIKVELFPDFSLDTINIKVPYPGAAPEEVEESICVRIEEGIRDLDGIRELRSVARQGLGVVTVEVEGGYEPQNLLDEIKGRIDAIDTFPEEAEEPTVEEVLIKREVLSIAVQLANKLPGESLSLLEEKSLRAMTERVREEVIALPGITQASISGLRSYEIAIEVSEQALRQYGLTFEAVSDAISNASLDLPGGSIKTDQGEILLRTKGQAYVAEDFESLVLVTRSDGTRLTIGDVAEVKDGFEESSLLTLFNGKPTGLVRVFEVGEQNTIKIANTLRQYIKEAQLRFPEGVELEAWRDTSTPIRERLSLLLKNGIYGLLLVLLILGLFLRPSLAFWVLLGIPISFLGTFMIMPWFGLSLNQVSLFGLIIVLGIVVDDAIVVGESIFSYSQRYGSGVNTSIEGTKAVATPVTFAILTTIVVLLPLFAMDGDIGQFIYTVPAVVIPTLLFSLIESKYILPRHLSRLNYGTDLDRKVNAIQLLQRYIANGLEAFIDRIYRPILHICLSMRYLTVLVFVALLVLSIGLIHFGWVKNVFFPAIPSTYIIASAVLPEGASIENTREAMEKVESALTSTLIEMAREGLRNPLLHKAVTVGGQAYSRSFGPEATGDEYTGDNFGEIVVELVQHDQRDLTSIEFTDRWRKAIGPLPETKSLAFSAQNGPGSEPPIEILLNGEDFQTVQVATVEIENELRRYEGLFDIRNDYSGGKEELLLSIKPEAEALGLTQTALAVQVRQAFYGLESQRVQRGRDDIAVMVRYPERERLSLGHLENLRIRTPDGNEVPLYDVAEVKFGQGLPTINRIDRKRSITIQANADTLITDAKGIRRDLAERFLPQLTKRYPNLDWSFQGQAKEEEESNSSLIRNFSLVLAGMYILMAIPFRSYLQPLVVMSVIPFGIVGAVLGHLILGLPFSLFSNFGMLALSGVLVNDSLVLVDSINNQRRNGASIATAIREAGAIRFRPILLTSLTTFFSLLPLYSEESPQAQFLIPMATSLGFGVLFVTFITLILVPVIYNILGDIQSLWSWISGRE